MSCAKCNDCGKRFHTRQQLSGHSMRLGHNGFRAAYTNKPKAVRQASQNGTHPLLASAYALIESAGGEVEISTNDLVVRISRK